MKPSDTLRNLIKTYFKDRPFHKFKFRKVSKSSKLMLNILSYVKECFCMYQEMLKFF